MLVPTTVLAPGAPRVGDSIDVKLWRGQITDIRVVGVTVGAVSRPLTRYLPLVEMAGLMLVIGLLLLVGYWIDRRSGYVR